jgi:uncharacterized membrane protein YdbT with pleckstrin-like domain
MPQSEKHSMTTSMPQETIILQDKPAIVPILAIWPTMGIAMACPFIVFATTFGKTLSFFTNIGFAIAITLFTLCIIRMLISLIRREVTTFTLTDKRIIFETGILNRDLDAVTLDRVKSVQIEWPPAGRIFNYANIIVFVWTEARKMRNVPRPQKWFQEISQHAK